VYRHPIHGLVYDYRQTLTLEQTDQLDKVANEHTYAAMKKSQQLSVLFCCIYGEDICDSPYDCDSRAEG
jgi:hypothetical protein